MIDKAIMIGIVIAAMISITVGFIEYFVPIQAKFELNAECRKTMLKMENQCGLTPEEKDALGARLAQKGFINTTITAPQNAAQGQDLSLKVEADYAYRRMVGLFINEMRLRHMTYNKITMARKIYN